MFSYFYVQVPTVSRSQPYWIIDMPPSYAHATGLPTGNTPPPSYSKVPFLPPIYERKADIPSVFRYGQRGSLPTDHIVEPFPNRHALRQGSLTSVQSLHFHVLENH